ncbi:hypothetical protein HRG_003040 [Hirsutella rhossiliensis]|uniref:Uncharacterized protein n=1 Tax=Hirsutella rhossiliensis TaxID=111463 RepID=A0A9P8N377_9HYPO|nr:uncharacterized protein HRG_03040 [Hirsutella rhossiliensis]KAH0965024.1 hypothetical protein HRG_03040 [Hirsutella rhossiliensis]
MTDRDDGQNHRDASPPQQDDGQPDPEILHPQEEPSPDQPLIAEDHNHDHQPLPAQGGDESAGEALYPQGDLSPDQIEDLNPEHQHQWAQVGNENGGEAMISQRDPSPDQTEDPNPEHQPQSAHDNFENGGNAEPASTSATNAALQDPRPATQSQVIEGWLMNIDFTQRGPEYPASSRQNSPEHDSSLTYRLWTPPDDDSDTSSSLPGSTPENQVSRAGYAGATKSRQRKQGNELQRILLGHGTVIDEATGLPTPAGDSFPVVPAVRDDFRTDWELPDDAFGNPQSVKAAPPWIPDPMDDSRDHPGFMLGRQVKMTTRPKRKRSLKKTRQRMPKERKIVQAKRKGKQTQRRADTPTPTPTPEPESEPEGLFKLSAELRLKIYRELLLSYTPVVVHSGWHLVYRHPATRQQQGERAGQHGLGLCTAILRAHPLFCAEGLTVLYGENTFLYRLRDPPPTVTDVSRLVYVDDEDECCDEEDDGGDDAPGERVEVEDDDGQESASDWDQDRRAEQEDGGRRRRSRRRRTKKARCDIYVDKYRHLFRHIVVEAEHNRFSRSTMRAMARAIRTFGPGSRPAANIQTLVVRVAPLRDPRGGPGPGDGDLEPQQQQQQHFTFVDFFAPDSPVLKAIQAVECHFLRVDLMTRYMDGPAERAGCSLTVDRRPEIVARRYYRDRCRGSRRLGDWLSDRAIRRERKRRARLVHRALQSLGDTVRKFCWSYVYRVVGGWDAFEDIGDGF